MIRCKVAFVYQRIVLFVFSKNLTAENLAWGQPAIQSSTWKETSNQKHLGKAFGPELAVDGNLNGNFYDGLSCARSLPTDKNSWWQVCKWFLTLFSTVISFLAKVDLGLIYRWDNIQIYNRIDSEQHFQNIQILTSNGRRYLSFVHSWWTDENIDKYLTKKNPNDGSHFKSVAVNNAVNSNTTIVQFNFEWKLTSAQFIRILLHDTILQFWYAFVN